MTFWNIIDLINNGHQALKFHSMIKRFDHVIICRLSNACRVAENSFKFVKIV